MDFEKSAIPGYDSSSLTSADANNLLDYWIDLEIVSARWSSALERNFTITGSEVRIANDREVDVRMGGVVFAEDDFNEFQRQAAASGASRFAVIEDIGQQGWKHFDASGFLRFSYPVVTSWSRIAKACPIAEDVFIRPIRAFFVVTDNGMVGKYANNDTSPPYELWFR